MRFLEKIIWALAVLMMAATVLVMVFWKPSPIPDAAIPIKEISAKPKSDKKRFDGLATSGRSGSGGRSGSSGTPSAGSTEPVKAAAPKLPFKPKAAKYEPKAFSVDRKFREKYGENYREVWEALQQAEAEFVTRPDGMKVARIVSIQPNSIVAKLGFAVGDEIYAVNGRDFTEFKGSMGDMYNEGKRLYDGLRNETEFQIELDRDGVSMVFTYHIPK